MAPKTVERILQVSLLAFNDAGPATVSTNRIAADLEMSAGNLYYHFKTKEQIVEVLVARFEEQLKPVQLGLRSVQAVDDLWLALHLMFEAIQAYRFVFRDADYLMKTFPGARRCLRRITASGIAAGKGLCTSLSHAGVLTASPEDQRIIAFQIVFTSTCWFNFARLVPDEIADPSDAGRAAYHVLTLMLPYLSGDSRHYLLYLRSKYAN